MKRLASLILASSICACAPGAGGEPQPAGGKADVATVDHLEVGLEDPALRAQACATVAEAHFADANERLGFRQDCPNMTMLVAQEATSSELLENNRELSPAVLQRIVRIVTRTKTYRVAFQRTLSFRKLAWRASYIDSSAESCDALRADIVDCVMDADTTDGCVPGPDDFDTFELKVACCEDNDMCFEASSFAHLLEL